VRKIQQISLILLSVLLVRSIAAYDQPTLPGQFRLIAVQKGTPQPGTIRYKNGLLLSGMCSKKETTLYPDLPDANLELRMVDQQARQVFASNRQAELPVVDKTQWPVLTFKIPQKSTAHDALPSGIVQMGPFDQNGIAEGTVTLPTGKEEKIRVGIISINEIFAEVRSLTHRWNYFISFDAIPGDKLVSILEHEQDYKTNAYRRLEMIRTLVKGKRPLEAGSILQTMQNDFPEFTNQTVTFQQSIREELARKFTSIFEQRSAVGQHQLAANGARIHPKNDLTPETLVRVDQLMKRYADIHRRIESLRLALPKLAANVEDAEIRTQSQQAVRNVIGQLDADTIDCFAAYELTADAADVPDANKLAMALSGWLMGAEFSTQNLTEATSLFEARLLMIDFLSTDETESDLRRSLADRLINLEGMNANRAAAMVRQLSSPMPLQVTIEKEGEIGHFEIPATENSAGAVGFVPPEYHESRQYPLVIAFPGEFSSPENYLAWWQSQAEQNGVIVVIPQLSAEGRINYGASAAEHTRFLNFLRKLKLGLRIDDDRVFVAGHGIGGEIAMDMATSHPDLFAGVVSICGLGRKHLQWTVYNAVDLPWYVVVGDAQGGWYERAGILFNKLLKRADDTGTFCDAMIVKYPNRGPESYLEEADDIFGWMDVHRRERFPEKIFADILRSTDLSWSWVQLNSIPAQFTKLDAPSNASDDGFRPAQLSAHRTKTGFAVTRFPGTSCSVLISPDMPAFDIQKPCLITNGSKRETVNYDPSIRVMLEQVRLTGDRGRLWFMKIDL
jgi:pimeloyl-ACP methyl ester carboxylesterase